MRPYSLAVALLALFLPGLALAARAPDEAGDPAAGRTFVQENCARCHNVMPSEETPSSHPLAPSFHTVANLRRTTEMGLRAFLRTPHAVMPNLVLTAQQTDDAIAYILSMRGH